MSGENFAGNIIINLANLPDFLRKPILKKRIAEFYTLSAQEKEEIVNNALEAGPGIPFPNFAKLFGTWLEVMAELPPERQEELYLAYIAKASANPEYLARFHLDGMLEVFMSIPESARASVSSSASGAVAKISDKQRNTLLLLIPDAIKKELGL